MPQETAGTLWKQPVSLPGAPEPPLPPCPVIASQALLVSESSSSQVLLLLIHFVAIEKELQVAC